MHVTGIFPRDDLASRHAVFAEHWLNVSPAMSERWPMTL